VLQINLAVCQLLGARKYSVSCPYRTL